MRNKLLIGFGLGCILTIFGLAIVTLFSRHNNATESQNVYSTVTINSKVMNVEIANTSQKHQSGLCCRDRLDPNSGMLFIYESPAVHRFWMKDTRIPLDMYWIDANSKIFFIEENVQPESYPKTFGPIEPSQFVLETNAGYAKNNGIKVGQAVDFE